MVTPWLVSRESDFTQQERDKLSKDKMNVLTVAVRTQN